MHILVLVLLVSPFYLNDFASIFIKDWRLWLFIDYVGVKFFPIMVTLWLIRSKTMRSLEFGLTVQSIPSFLVVFPDRDTRWHGHRSKWVSVDNKTSGLLIYWHHAGHQESCLELD